VRIPRVDAEAASVVIDGALDEAAWRSAAVLAGFSQFSPQDGVPAADSTQVLLWYSSTALYGRSGVRGARCRARDTRRP
jgi:hypothetical protein